MTHNQDNNNQCQVQTDKSQQVEKPAKENLMKQELSRLGIKPMAEVGITWLWAELDAMFPNRWIARMGLVAVDGEISQTAQSWQCGLHGIKREWVIKAILELSNANHSFIPELGEFRDLCLKFKPREYFTKPVDDFVPLSPEQHKAKISALRNALGDL